MSIFARKYDNPGIGLSAAPESVIVNALSTSTTQGLSAAQVTAQERARERGSVAHSPVADFASLPTVQQDGEPLEANQIVLVKAPTVGAGTETNPDFSAGWYKWDGTVWGYDGLTDPIDAHVNERGNRHHVDPTTGTPGQVERINAAGDGYELHAPILPIDEDNFASDSDVRPPTQQSAKAYIDRRSPFLAALGWHKTGGKLVEQGSNRFQIEQISLQRWDEPTQQVQAFSHTPANPTVFRVADRNGYVLTGFDGTDLSAPVDQISQAWGYDPNGTLEDLSAVAADTNDGANYRAYMIPATGEVVVLLPQQVVNTVTNAFYRFEDERIQLPAILTDAVFLGFFSLDENAANFSFSASSGPWAGLTGTAAAADSVPYVYATNQATADALVPPAIFDGIVVGIGAGATYVEYRVLTTGADFASSTVERMTSLAAADHHFIDAASADITIAVVDEPSIAEVKLYADAQAPVLRDQHLLFTGTSDSDDPVIRHFHIDTSGDVRLINSVIAATDIPASITGHGTTLATLPQTRKDGTPLGIGDWARLTQTDGTNAAGWYQVTAITPAIVYTYQWGEPEAASVSSTLFTDVTALNAFGTFDDTTRPTLTNSAITGGAVRISAAANQFAVVLYDTANGGLFNSHELTFVVDLASWVDGSIFGVSLQATGSYDYVAIDKTGANVTESYALSGTRQTDNVKVSFLSAVVSTSVVTIKVQIRTLSLFNPVLRIGTLAQNAVTAESNWLFIAQKSEIPAIDASDKKIGIWTGNFALSSGHQTLTVPFDITECDYLDLTVYDDGSSPWTWSGRIEGRSIQINPSRILVDRNGSSFVWARTTGVNPALGQIQFRDEGGVAQNIGQIVGYKRSQ